MLKAVNFDALRAAPVTAEPFPYMIVPHFVRADAVLVTCDSVNLVSEACATGKPVMVIDLPGGSDKFRRFHQAMRDDGMTRPFKGHIEKWDYKPLNDMQLIAARIREMMAG